jgi:uncharacterized membrane protein (DUF373 family)
MVNDGPYEPGAESTDHRTTAPGDVKSIGRLRWVIRWAVRALAVLMTGVIPFGVADVCYVLYTRLINNEPSGFLQVTDMLATFGTFMAVLIAIEIFINIVSYLRDDVIHIEIVMATALMTIARKIIVLDTRPSSPPTSTPRRRSSSHRRCLLARSVALASAQERPLGSELHPRAPKDEP